MQTQHTTAPNKTFPGLYVPPTAAASLVCAVELGDFDFSAVLDKFNGDIIALISGKFRGNEFGPISGIKEPYDGHNSRPIAAFLTAYERQNCVLSCVSVSNDLGLTSELYDAARAIRVAEIETKIMQAVRNA